MAAVAPSNSTSILDFSSLPPIYVLESQVTSQDLREAEEILISSNADLTYDVREAGVVLTNIFTERRVRLELKWLGVDLVEDEHPKPQKQGRKRMKLREDSSYISSEQVHERGDIDILLNSKSMHSSDSSDSQSRCNPRHEEFGVPAGHLLVVRLAWLSESITSGALLSLPPFVMLRGKKTHVAADKASHRDSKNKGRITIHSPYLPEVKGSHPSPSVRRAVYQGTVRDAKGGKRDFSKRGRIRDALQKDFDGKSFSSSTKSAVAKPSNSRTAMPIQLVHQSTSENDETEQVTLPQMPEWVVNKIVYSCQRATPAIQPNEDFILNLDKIRMARLLTSDEIGVRAYSTSIAAIAAYPHPIRSSKEILALPGCDHKIAHLFHEYKTKNGEIRAVTELEADEALSTLREFFDIWGVGAVTARDFYYDKGWKDLDDVIEFGWDSLSRVQQIGLKYYDEFKLKIPRAESELIAETIVSHARKATDPGVQAIIVGGYRRGKIESGDVDVILSHPDLDITLDLVSQVVASLEKDGWITHTLTLNLTNTKRNQEPLQARPSGGHGFDTLDKALVVWQDPNWGTKEPDTAGNPKAKNPNPHRRVDIIISPWKTIGCAVAGWSSGTTFQRDLRRYTKNIKGWKFDSSGVRDRVTGNWIDLEGWSNEMTRSKDWKESEIRVFEGLGLKYWEPEERCTW